MKALLFSVLALFFSSSLFASAIVCIKGNNLEVYSNLIFYGDKASQSGPACAQEIYRMFNQPDVNVEIAGKRLKVKFKISYQIENESEIYSSVNINSRTSNNYIRIEDKANNEKDGRSNHSLGGNCGFYAHADNLGTSTTCAHEYAHGLGLTHYDKRSSGYGSNSDLRGTSGKPGIMAARGFLVDSKYQWEPKTRAGAPGGTIQPLHREVRKEDILDLKLHELQFNSYGCADLGKVEGIAYTKNGKETNGDNSYLLDALNYLGKGLSGDLGQPILCK